MATAIEIKLEEGEWYVLCNWLRERENQLMYALRPRSDEWRAVHDLRVAIDEQRTDGSTVQRVTLPRRDWTRLLGYLRRRSRVLLLKPWRDRERRDVRHLRDHLLAQLDADE